MSVTTKDAGPPLARLITVVHESWKYLLVSVVALAVDYGLMVALTEWAGLNYLVSAAAGFGAGLLVNYGLSVTLVFSQRRLASRRLEFVGFFLIGMVGLGLNELLMKTFVEMLHLDYRLAKIPAAAIGFVFNFGTRRVLLFTAARSPRPPADDA